VSVVRKKAKGRKKVTRAAARRTEHRAKRASGAAAEAFRPHPAKEPVNKDAIRRDLIRRFPKTLAYLAQ